MLETLTEKSIEQLNNARRYLTFKHTWITKQYFNCHSQTKGLFFGNQAGKNAILAYDYVCRILGVHPIPERNILYFECENKCVPQINGLVKGHRFAPYKVENGNITICLSCGALLKPHMRECRIIRFVSEVQPLPSGVNDNFSDSQEGTEIEIRNTQYPEFKKWLPPYLLKRDITHRDRSMIIADPFGCGDIIIDFSSYNQSKQSQAGVQRISVWADEQPPIEFLDEQTPRLFAEEGDLIITFTPTEEITYLYDQIFERAKMYYRTKTMCKEYYQKYENRTVAQIERTNSPVDITVFQAATDDNPTFAGRDFDEMYSRIDDLDKMFMRRFGIFKAISGRIFKSFDPRIHIIDGNKYFAIAS